MSHLPHRLKSRTSSSYLHSIGLLLVLVQPIMVQGSYQLVPRWGAASVYIPSPPSLLIQGGKTDASNSGYTQAFSTTDLISLSLSSPIDPSSPSASLITSSPGGPAYAWHTLSHLEDGTILLFGGDATGSEPVETSTNSAWLLSLNESTAWTHEPTDWASQPMRRIYHSAVSSGDKVYITGGLKNDGSGQAFADVYVFDTATTVFQPMVPLPSGLYHHTSILLPNGTLVVVGGMAIALDTGNPSTIDLSTLYVLDTTVDSPAWGQRDVNGDAPSGRRGASLVLNDAGDTAFLFGGADAALTEVLGDGWNLELTTCAWTNLFNSSDVTGRFDHTAANIGGDQVLIVGGYGSSSPVDAGIHLYNMQSDAWETSLSPSGTPAGSSSPSGASGQQAESQGITIYTSGGQAMTATLNSGGDSAASDSPSGGPLPTGFNNTTGPGHLTSSQRVAIGVAAGALLLAAAGVTFLLARKRRNRQRQRFGASSYGPTHPWEKDPPGSGEGDKSSWGRKALAAGYAVTNKFGSKGRNDKYAVLADPRRATLLGRDGVVLRSPKSPAKSGHLKYSPSKIRRDMLGDEDSRRFATIPEEDWVTERDDGTWRPARSLLGSIHNSKDEDPFEEPSSPLSPPPVIRGGPVPTPRDSRADLHLDPFDDFRAAIPDHLDQYESALDDAQSITLLAPPPRRERPLSDQSIPRSYASRSTSASDLEEGIVGEAQVGLHRQPTLLSPEPGQPVKRTQSFFQRMTQGGVAFLRQPVQPETPAPISRLLTSHREDDEISIDGDEDELAPPRRYNHTYQASLTSIDSVRSMRDMVIIQRQESHSSAEDVVIERADGETPPRHLYHQRHGTSVSSLTSSRIGRSIADAPTETVSSVGADVDFGGDGLNLALSLPVQSTPPNPAAISSLSINSRETVQTISDQSVASTTTFGTPLPSPQQAETVGTPTSNATPTRAVLPSSPPTPVPSTPKPPSPSPARTHPESPAASPFGKRRPVKDLVNSINRRGGGTPMSLFSPTSQYSPLTAAPPSPGSVVASGSPRSATSRVGDQSPIRETFTGGSGTSNDTSDQVTPMRAGRPLSYGGSVRSGTSVRSGGSGRPKTIYEAVKRERLSVANPDSSR